MFSCSKCRRGGRDSQEKSLLILAKIRKRKCSFVENSQFSAEQAGKPATHVGQAFWPANIPILGNNSMVDVVFYLLGFLIFS